MKQASGHEIKGKETWVYLLIKALYGTKQAARAWQQHLAKQLIKKGCTPLVVDPATYVRREHDAFLMIGTHVDDLFVLFNATGAKLKDEIWQHLTSVLTIKNMGDAVWTLQMSIQRDHKEGILKISQASFTREVLRRFNLQNAASTPAVETGDEAIMLEQDLPSTIARRRTWSSFPSWS